MDRLREVAGEDDRRKRGLLGEGEVGTVALQMEASVGVLLRSSPEGRLPLELASCSMHVRRRQTTHRHELARERGQGSRERHDSPTMIHERCGIASKKAR